MTDIQPAIDISLNPRTHWVTVDIGKDSLIGHSRHLKPWVGETSLCGYTPHSMWQTDTDKPMCGFCLQAWRDRNTGIATMEPR